ncbi:hypothetical protein [Aquimarina megaterium]|uniref:hypothetical protein n=1 Tax=Aquimarina megaterium TaxID=1443666 RepID=UPI000470720F|nr:hypothetical protein [Aquimarina megaterium]
MKNQHQTKKLELKKLNITLLTSHKLSQVKAGEVPSAAVNLCEGSIFRNCRSKDYNCGNKTKDIAFE